MGAGARETGKLDTRLNCPEISRRSPWQNIRRRAQLRGLVKRSSSKEATSRWRQGGPRRPAGTERCGGSSPVVPCPYVTAAATPGASVLPKINECFSQAKTSDRRLCTPIYGFVA